MWFEFVSIVPVNSFSMMVEYKHPVIPEDTKVFFLISVLIDLD